MIVLILAGLLPLLVPYFRDLGQRPPYTLYPLLIVAAVALGVSRLRELPLARVRPGGWLIAGALLGAGLACLAIGSATYLRWLAAPAFLFTTAGLVWRMGGPALARALAPVGILLLTIVPPPARGETTLTVALQRISVEASARILDVAGVAHVRTGNVLTLPGHQLLIEEACSGINSVIAVTAFTLLLGFWRHRPAAWIVALVPIALLFVIGLNIVRIAGGALLLAGPGWNVFGGAVHEWIGMILFAGGVGLVLSADAAIELLTARRRVTSIGAVDPNAARPAVVQSAVAGGRTIAWVFAIAYITVGGWSAYHLRACWPEPRLSADAVFHAPPSVGEWTLLPPRPDGGEADQTTTTAKHTRHWSYRAADGRIAEVALAFPFTAWFHDPRVCYAAAGWTAGEFSAVDTDDTAYRFDMTQLGGRRGTVFFADFAESGMAQHPFERPADGSWLMRHLALTRRAAFYEPACEVQTLVASDEAITDAQRASTQELFTTLCATLREQVVAFASAQGGSR